MAISLRPETKKELVKLREVYQAFEAAREEFLSYDVSAPSEPPTPSEPGYHSHNTFPKRVLTEEQKRRKQEKQALGKKCDECEDAYDKQLEVVGKTFTSEYGLNEARATIEDNPKGKRTIYHSTGVNKHDIRKICSALSNGDMHPGRFTSNRAGIATYFGNLPFFEHLHDDEFAPEELIEAHIFDSAKIHEVRFDDYGDCNLEEYEPLFDPEDYQLLCELEKSYAMHVRSIFDVALGYDACVRHDFSSDVLIYAIYKRDILQLSKSPIVKFSDVVAEPSDQD